jgi:dihydrofolate reductase
MAKLVYTAISSLDGYVADEAGTFDWAAPDEEVHAFVNDLERPVGTYLYGRRMYEVMSAWQDEAFLADASSASPAVADYGQIWRAAAKVVYSTTLPAPTTPKTRVERSFDAAAVRELVEASATDVSVGGPTLAAHALATGIVDECHLLVHPVVVGGGTPAFSRGLRASLELIDVRRFASGVMHLHYRLQSTHGGT